MQLMLTHLLRPFRSGMLALVLAHFGAAALAQAGAALCAVPPAGAVVSSYSETLARVARSSCLGDSKADTHSLVTRFDALVDQPIVLGQTERLLGAIDLLTEAAQQGSVGPHEVDLWRAMLVELGTARAQIAALKVSTGPRAWLDGVEAAIPAKWKGPGGGFARPISIGGQQVRLLDPPSGCEDGKPCGALQSRISILRVANLMARLQRYAEQNSLDEQYAAAELGLAQWEAYRTNARHQYMWEVALNGALMGEDLCPRDAGTGMRMGFCAVPNSQVIFMHPDAALRFARTAQKASELKPALLIEIIGRYQWEWAVEDGRKTATMLKRRGYSLAATYSQTETEKEWAYGPMLHYGDYSLAITKAKGGKWSLVLNLTLGERYFGRKQQVVDELAKIKKTDVLDLVFK